MKATHSQANDILAPKPVHPTAVRHHGLFGQSFVHQHMMIDERWSPSSLTDEFKNMHDLLAKRLIFKKLEDKASRKRVMYENRKLRRHCRDGRAKLQMALYGENTLKIRNYLMNHKDMQRLYQKMPIHLVVDNIDQRTFVMQKERDRLTFRLNQLKKVYEEKLMERATIQNRIRYQNEFVLEEEIKANVFRRKIEDSNVRLKAIKTINATYKKIIQVLRHDAIFYEPIMRSLCKDIEDQSNFIKHILYLGMPAIAKFKELNEEYRRMEEKARKKLQSQLQFMGGFKKASPKRLSQQMKQPKEPERVAIRMYERETRSMMDLKTQLETIEVTIKQIKFATLSSQATEIYPRIKNQVENNLKLEKTIQQANLGHEVCQYKKESAKLNKSGVRAQATKQEIQRLNTIEELKDRLAKEDEREKEILAHIQNRTDAMVLLRFSCWNLCEILRYVDRPVKALPVPYPNSYLKLPLLKFEMLTMRACPPEAFETNIKIVLSVIKHKLSKLMKVYRELAVGPRLVDLRNEYHEIFLDTLRVGDTNEGGEEQQPEEEEKEGLFEEAKITHNVPNRKQIKARSAKLVEELSKKED